MKQPLTVSIVIPAYNEADTIHDCLMAISQQTVSPYEVILVDNNSTDATVAIAQQFRFVRVLRERRQGVVHARNTAFSQAKGEIIGRIDADTIIDTDWVETVQNLFTDSTHDAISGSVTYHNVPFARFFSVTDRVCRTYLGLALGKEYAMQGANLALRAEAWRSTKRQMCSSSGMHEDFDLSIHLREGGYSTLYTPSLKASVTFRQAGSQWKDYLYYVLLNPGTYAQHGVRRRVVMYPVIGLALISYPLLHVLHRGYDKSKDTFSFKKVFMSTFVSRVNPATFVD